MGGAGTAARGRPHDFVTLALGLTLPVVALLLYSKAENAIDQPRPDGASAAWLLTGCALVGVSTIVALIVSQRSPRLVLASAAFGLIVLAPLAAGLTMEGYGPDSWAGLLPFDAWGNGGGPELPFILIWSVLSIVALALLGDERRSSVLAASGAAALVTALAAASVYLLVTIARQSEVAAAAHRDAGALPVVALCAVLLGLAARRR